MALYAPSRSAQDRPQTAAEREAARRARKRVLAEASAVMEPGFRLYALSDVDVALIRKLLHTRVTLTASRDAKAEYEDLGRRLSQPAKD